MAKRETTITNEIAALERTIGETTNETLKKALRSKITRLQSEMKGIPMTAKQLALILLKQRQKIKALAKRDFNDLIRRLSKKPEYYFLKAYSRKMIEDDMSKKAKPVGWRFKGRGDYRIPSTRQIAQGKRDGTVYREVRPRRSDVSQAVQLAQGGEVSNFETDYAKFESHIKDGYGYVDSDYVEDTWEKISDIPYRKAKIKLLGRLKKNNLLKMAKGGAIGNAEKGYGIIEHASDMISYDEYIDSDRLEEIMQEEGITNADVLASWKNDWDKDDWTVRQIKTIKSLGLNKIPKKGLKFAIGDTVYTNPVYPNQMRYGVVKSYRPDIENYIVEFNDGVEEGYSEKDLNKSSDFKMAKGGKLIGKQANLDRNKNGKIDSEDLRMIRENKMAKGGGVTSCYSSFLNYLDETKGEENNISEELNRNGYIICFTEMGEKICIIAYNPASKTLPVESVFSKFILKQLPLNMQAKYQKFAKKYTQNSASLKEANNIVIFSHTGNTAAEFSDDKMAKGGRTAITDTSDVELGQGEFFAKGGGVQELKKDNFVWNAVGKKLVVDKVTKDEYFLSGFGSKTAMPFSKSKVHNYIKTGEWTRKPKMAKGGNLGSAKKKVEALIDSAHEQYSMGNNQIGFQEWLLTNSVGKLFKEAIRIELKKIETNKMDDNSDDEIKEIQEEIKVRNARIKKYNELIKKGDFSKYSKSELKESIEEAKDELEKLKDELTELKSESKYAKGGSIEKENSDMVRNQNKAISHHTKELHSQLEMGKNTPAWVVSKVSRASNDLSDVTHYLDGEKMAKGGTIQKWAIGEKVKYYSKGMGNKSFQTDAKVKEILKGNYPIVVLNNGHEFQWDGKRGFKASDLDNVYLEKC